MVLLLIDGIASTDKTLNSASLALPPTWCTAIVVESTEHEESDTAIYIAVPVAIDVTLFAIIICWALMTSHPQQGKRCKISANSMGPKNNIFAARQISCSRRLQ
jgi:mannose/fructose/N-acetylgalactosamine-specific phosphotransferase system component IIC